MAFSEKDVLCDSSIKLCKMAVKLVRETAARGLWTSLTKPKHILSQRELLTDRFVLLPSSAIRPGGGASK